MTTLYEWDLETVDGQGDDAEILEHDHFDKLSLIPYRQPNQRLVLVRDTGNDAEGLTDRLWFYFDGSNESSFFTDSTGSETQIAVPKKYMAEFEKHKERLEI